MRTLDHHTITRPRPSATDTVAITALAGLLFGYDTDLVSGVRE